MKTDNREKIREEFERELSFLKGQREHYKCGNYDSFRMYDIEVKSVERLLRVLDVLFNEGVLDPNK